MSWWRYRGRCTGRVLHFLYHYVGFDAAEHATVDFYRGKEVMLHGRRLATFEWSERFGEADVPVFKFDGEHADDYERNQYDKREAAVADALPGAPPLDARTPADVAVLFALNPEIVRFSRLRAQMVEHTEPVYFVADMMVHDIQCKVLWCKAGESLYYWDREIGAWLRGPKDEEAAATEPGSAAWTGPPGFFMARSRERAALAGEER